MTDLEKLELKLEFIKEMCEPPLTQIVEVQEELLALIKQKKGIGFKNEKEA